MRYRHDSRQRLPIGSGMSEAACKTVFTQRRKRSGMSWTRTGGQGIVDLRVLWRRGVWENVHQRALAPQSMPMTQEEIAKVAQLRQLAA
jgi:hypothetical protein